MCHIHHRLRPRKRNLDQISGKETERSMKRTTINISRPEPQKTIDEIEEREKQITYQKHQGRLDYIPAVERVVGTINRRIVHFGAYRKPIGNPNETADNEQTTKGLQKFLRRKKPIIGGPKEWTPRRTSQER